MGLLIKNITIYQRTELIMYSYKAEKNKAQYRAQNESALILHEVAAKALKSVGVISKLPSITMLQAEKEKLYPDYGKSKNR